MNAILQKIAHIILIVIFTVSFFGSVISVEAVSYYCPNGGVLDTNSNTCILTPSTPGICPLNWTVAGSICTQVPTTTCNYVAPAGGIIDVSLADAELRTDQDFTCNYTAKICFTIFQDIDADGTYNTGIDPRIAGLAVDLLNNDGVTQVYTQTSSDSGQQCFEPLANITYKVKIPTPPTPFSTTGGNEQTIPITYSSGVVQVAFGYTNGTLSLTSQPSINLATKSVTTANDSSCGVIQDIQVIDTRIGGEGWSVTATVDDFKDTLNNTITLPIANKFSSSPSTVSIVSGVGSNRFPGQTKTVSSITDPFTAMTASPGSGNGTTKVNTNVCQIIDAYGRAGNFATSVLFTVF